MNNKILTPVIIVLALAVGGGFFAGTQYQKSKVPSSAGSDHQNVRGMLSERFSGQEQPISGEIITKDNERITVKNEDGGSKIIFLSDDTTIRKTETGSLDDLSEGTRVLIFGSENADGSITANNIQLNPTFRSNHTITFPSPPDNS